VTASAGAALVADAPTAAPSVDPGVNGGTELAASSSSSGGRSGAGILILVAIAAVGGLAYAGRSVFARFSRKGAAS
jgi:hypothetical protein